MKKYLILFISIYFLSGNGFAQILTKDEINKACKVLVEVTDTSLAQMQYDRVVVYSNAFKFLKQQYIVEERYIKYFNEVNFNNIKQTGKWTISLNYPPQKPPDKFVYIDMNNLSPEDLMKIEQELNEAKQKKGIK